MSDLFSERLVLARKNAGLTQKELAKKIGMAPSSLSAYEQKGKYPTLDVACKMAKSLNVSLEWLATGKNFSGKGDSKNQIPEYKSRLELFALISGIGKWPFGKVKISNGMDSVIIEIQDTELPDIDRYRIAFCDPIENSSDFYEKLSALKTLLLDCIALDRKHGMFDASSEMFDFLEKSIENLFPDAPNKQGLKNEG